MVILQVVWHSVHWQISLVLVEEYPLHGVEDLLSKLRLEHVVVLRLHMHDELNVVGFRALGYSLDGGDWDLSLYLILFNIVKTHISQQESPILLHAPSVDLDDDARKDDLLTPLSVEL